MKFVVSSRILSTRSGDGGDDDDDDDAKMMMESLVKKPTHRVVYELSPRRFFATFLGC